MIAIPPSIRIGATASIEMQSEEGGTREYKTRIEDIDGGLIHAAVPSERGELVNIGTGEYITLAVQTPSAANMFVEGEVVGRRAQPFPLLVVRPVTIESNQQRMFHRVQVKIDPIAVWWWAGEGAPPPSAASPESGSRGNGSGGVWQRVGGMITDLSGGGVGLLSDVDLPKDSVVRIKFPLPVSQDPMEAAGRVMLTRPRPGRTGTKWQIGIKFEDMSKVDQERLVKANHQYQIEERRKARGL